MRHRKNTRKLSRDSQHRDAMLSNMAISLITHERIETTLPKAKALRPFVEKLVTLGKKGTLHHRRLAVSKLKQSDPHNHTPAKRRGRPAPVSKLFGELAERFKDREGGYTRIYKLGPRQSDAAPMALIEWVEPLDVSSKEDEKIPAKKPKAEGDDKKTVEKTDVVDVKVEK